MGKSPMTSGFSTLAPGKRLRHCGSVPCWLTRGDSSRSTKLRGFFKWCTPKRPWISILKWVPKGSPKMSKGFPGTMECSPSSFGDNVDDFPRPLPFPYKNASQFDISSVIIYSHPRLTWNPQLYAVWKIRFPK